MVKGGGGIRWGMGTGGGNMTGKERVGENKMVKGGGGGYNMGNGNSRGWTYDGLGGE